MSKLLQAIKSYRIAVSDYDPRIHAMSKLEIPKIEIADAVLEMFGFARVNMGTTANYFVSSNRGSVRDLANCGFVYMMRNETSGLVKIGFSKNPTKREMAIKYSDPGTKLIGFWAASMADEKIIHVAYNGRHSHGEWFNLDETAVTAIKTFLEGVTH